MSTKLYLRNIASEITDTGDALCYRLSTTAGAASDTGVVNTTSGGTNIQWTKTAGGSSMAWISDRVPSGGFTLTSVNVSAWLEESANQANAKGRFRIYKYHPGTPTITELGGSPFDTAAELGSAGPGEITWTANVTDTAFAEDDRILVRFFITNTGTMGASRTCTITFNAADAATGDSFATLAETVSLKSRAYTLVCSAGAYAITGISAGLLRARILALAAGALTLSIADTITVDGGLALGANAYSLSGQAATFSHGGVSSNTTLTAAAGSYALSGMAAGLAHGYRAAAAAGSLALSIADTITVDGGLPLTAGSYSLTGVPLNFIGAGFSLAAGSYTLSGQSVTLARPNVVLPQKGPYAISGGLVTLAYGRKPPMAAGSLLLTGGAVGLSRGYKLSHDAGSYALSIADEITVDGGIAINAGAYALSGVAATLTYTQSGNRVLGAAAGSYALSGVDASLRSTGPFLILASGSYAWTIADEITVDRGLTQSTGSYTLSGTAANLTQTHPSLPLAAGSYSIVGADSVNDTTLVQSVGVYSLSGVSSTLKLNRGAPLVTGAYTLTGTPASPTLSHISTYAMTAAAGSLGVSGSSVATRLARAAVAATGAYQISGQLCGLKAGHYLGIPVGSYTLSGQPMTPVRGHGAMTIDAGSYALSGVASTLRPTYNFLIDPGQYTIAGREVRLTGSAFAYGTDIATITTQRRIIFNQMRG